MDQEHARMYHISPIERTRTTEHVILRAIEGDPRRYKPLAHHAQPTTITSQQKTTASMYTLESRYRSIPSKVLPKIEPRVYYIDGKTQGRTMMSPLTEPLEMKSHNQEPESVSNNILEPKAVSQQVLYSIAETKTSSEITDRPNSTINNTESPMYYTVLGHPHRPSVDTGKEITKITSSTTDKPPLLYPVIGAPKSGLSVQEPIREPSPIPEKSQPLLYTIVNEPHAQTSTPEPIREPPAIPEKNQPLLYTIVNEPHAQTSVQEPVRESLPIPEKNQSLLYTIVNEPHVQTSVQEPIKPTLPIEKRLQPNLYTIVGNPTAIPPAIIGPATLVKNSPVTPSTLYTASNENNVPSNKSHENHALSSPTRKNPKDTIENAIVEHRKLPQIQTNSKKPQVVPQQKQPPETPLVYSIVGKPNALVKEKADSQTKKAERKIIPQAVSTPAPPPPQRPAPPPRPAPVPSVLPSIKKDNGILERQKPLEKPPPAQQPKPKPQPKPKESKLPKSETVFFPLTDDEHALHPKQARTMLDVNPGQIHHRNYEIPKYDPLKLPDYISPYSYHPTKPYREETYNPLVLPSLAHYRYDRRPRQPLYEPRNLRERKNENNSTTAYSLERYPVNTKQRSRLWDYENLAQTDTDDDSQAPKSFRHKRRYRRIRPRTPWIPVW